MNRTADRPSSVSRTDPRDARCPHSLSGAHKFEGRYSLSSPDLSGGLKFQGYDIHAVLDALKAKTYVRDVCVRCGLTIPPLSDGRLATSGNSGKTQ